MDQEKKIDYSALNPPEPMGGMTSGQRSAPPPPKPSGPANYEPPKQPIVPILLMFFLALLIVAAVLVFFSWKGWIKLGQNFWNKTTPTPTVSLTVSPSPAGQSPLGGASPSPSSSTEPSTEPSGNLNDQTRKKDLANLKKTLESYFAANGNYPSTNGVLIKTSDSGNILAASLVPAYLNKLPDDPLAPANYYGYQSDGASFQLSCVLEDKTDPEGFQSGNVYLYKINNTK